MNFRDQGRLAIDRANTVIEEYAAQGYSLTLRQLYYQFVQRNWIPNEQKEYDRLSEHVTNGRRAGLIDWNAIVDLTREIVSPASWADAQEIIRSASTGFRLDLWKNQPAHVEVWFEKDALMNVFERAANEQRIGYFSMRGYASDSSLWRAATRLKAKQDEGKNVIVLHFGDHDPSGIDMTRDIEERLNLFQATPEIRRKALNIGQVKRYKLINNPAKESDSRHSKYKAEFGVYSWELDALEPSVLVKLVRDEVEKLIDAEQWAQDKAEEDKQRESLSKCDTLWAKVVKFLNRKSNNKK